MLINPKSRLRLYASLKIKFPKERKNKKKLKKKKNHFRYVILPILNNLRWWMMSWCWFWLAQWAQPAQPVGHCERAGRGIQWYYSTRPRCSPSLNSRERFRNPCELSSLVQSCVGVMRSCCTLVRNNLFCKLVSSVCCFSEWMWMLVNVIVCDIHHFSVRVVRICVSKM